MPLQGVSVAFADNALTASPTWTRLDAPPHQLVDKWSIDRGRSSELDKTETGTANVDFAADRAGQLDPTNTAGPFYGFIDPMRQGAIALQNPVDLNWYTLIRGHVDWPEWSVDTSGKFTSAQMDINDAFDLFANLLMSPGHHGTTPPSGSTAEIYFAGGPGQWSAGTFKHVDQRIIDALDAAGWSGTGLTSSTLRDVFSGNVTVQENVYERLDALLNVLRDAADAEFPGVANCYMSKDGVFRFRGRFARFNPTNPSYGINQWKVGDLAAAQTHATTAPISGLKFRRSKNDIINAAQVLPQGVAESDVPGALVFDATSTGKYGWRTKSEPDLLVYQGHDDVGATTSALTEAGKVATYLVNNYKDPKTRVTSIQFRPIDPVSPNGPALWDLMCRVELGDLLTLTTTHPGGGGFNEDFYVEGIHYEAEPMNDRYPDITLELDVSPRSFYSSNPFGGVDGSIPTAFLSGAGSLTATGS